MTRREDLEGAVTMLVRIRELVSRHGFGPQRAVDLLEHRVDEARHPNIHLAKALLDAEAGGSLFSWWSHSPKPRTTSEALELVERAIAKAEAERKATP